MPGLKSKELRGPWVVQPLYPIFLVAHCRLAKYSPPEADTRLCCNQLGVGSVSKGGGEQFALNMAKDYKDHCFAWLSLGHGVAYDDFRTHRLLATEEGMLSLWAQP